MGGTVIALALWLGGSLDRWENTTWVWRVKQFARPSAATESIKIILLDQQSLDWGEEQNHWSWPWPREVYGPIIDFCRRGGARVIAFDVLYTEPSGFGVWDDQALGTVIGQAPDFIGALFLQKTALGDLSWPADYPEPAWPIADLKSKLTSLRLHDLEAPGATFPIGEVGRSATTLGNVSDRPDQDGVFRRVSLLRVFDGRVVPSLGLAAFLLDQDTSTSPQRLDLAKGRIEVGQKQVPMSAGGRSILRFVGPTGTHASFSAAAVIQSELRMRAGEQPVLSPDVFRDSHVFFGFSAPGLLDLRPTPLSEIGPGVEIHATVLDNLLTDGFLREAPRGVVGLAVALLAVAGGLLIVLGKRAWQSVALFVLLLPVPALGGLLAYGMGYWWPVVVGELAVALALVGGVVLNYATEGRQKQFIKQAFRFYLSPHVIEQILRDPAQLQLGGERRELTILFCDLEGFTTLAEKLDPLALTTLLNDYLSDMTEIVLEEGGTLDKYEGDAFIAFWNAPLAQPDHAARGCRAALRCSRRLAERREEYRRQSGAELRMRIGLNTGDVVVGNMGSRQRFNYTVLGDAANLASRLEGANKLFGTTLMISAATWAPATEQVVVRQIGPLRVVGRREPVQVYELLGLAGEPAPTWLSDFERGLELCGAGELSEALAVFEVIPDDPVSRTYAVHCRRLLDETDPRWDGVWNLTQK